MGFLDRVFGDPNKKYLKKVQPLVEKINSLEPEIEKLSDEKLRGQTFGLKERLGKGESLDDLLPEAFASVRETAKRTLGQRHFDVQLIGGVALHQGKIAEMVTGEGKTLTATLPLYLNALEGKGVHLVTVNDYLAKRDAVWMGQIYHALGLSVGCIVHDAAYIYDRAYAEETQNSKLKTQNHNSKLKTAGRDTERDTLGSFKIVETYLRPCSRKEAYGADITYGTNNEFGFDFLRDNMVYDAKKVVQRGFYYAIVDEVDSILIDEARTPLIISQPDVESAGLYQEFSRITPQLKENSHYNIDEKMKAVTLTEEGIEKVEKILGVENIYAAKGMKYLRYLEQALKAQVLFKRDRDYVVKEGQVIIVDEFTGRLLPGRRYSEGLHQAIEAKEGLEVKPESKTLASITFQNYFRQYEKLAGMTGTALTSAEEFDKVYQLEVVSVPTNKPLIRQDLPDKVFKSNQGKFRAIVKEIKKKHEQGQPVLVGTTSIEKNEHLSRLLDRAGLPHNILNAKNHEREGEIIAQAGRLGAVTCATNMAGRGVDIILGGNPPDPKEAAEIKEAGGLAVIGTERHEARRIDNQLRGRAGRQGDPGASQFFLSLEDDLMRVFGGERIKGLMERFNFPEDEPIEVGLVSKAIEEAQSKIEGMNLDIRKHLLEYDEVLNKHRGLIYKKRRDILESEDLKAKVLTFFKKQFSRIIDFHCVSSYPQDWNIEEIFEEVKTMLPLTDEVHLKLADIVQTAQAPPLLKEEILSYLTAMAEKLYEARERELTPEKMRQLERIVFLRTLDFLWTDHLTMMDHLRDSVRLRAYGQKDPLVEYKTEGHKTFKHLLANFEAEVARTIFKVKLARPPSLARQPVFSHPAASGVMGRPITITPKAKKIGRNDPCPCGSGIKYKKCHGR